MPIRTLIVDDHQIVLDGISLMLEPHDEIVMVAQALSGQQAIDYVSEHEVDVLIMDLNMPNVNGLEACKKIKIIKPSVKILMLSMLSELKMIQRVMNAGANGYMLKNSGQEEIIAAILRVHEGHDHYDERIVRLMLNPKQHKEVKTEYLYPTLSRREKEILKLIIDEHTTAEIARKLFISFGTVESHRRNMISKLGVRNTAGLVGAAFKYDLLG